MSDDVHIALTVDPTQAHMSIEEVKAAAEEVVLQWGVDRTTLIQQIREGFTMISTLMSSFRQAMSFFGAQIDPFYSALIGMVLSTASMMISAGSLLQASVFGAPIGVVLVALAISFQLLTLGKLVVDKAETMNLIQGIQQSIAKHGLGDWQSKAWGFT